MGGTAPYRGGGVELCSLKMLDGCLESSLSDESSLSVIAINVEAFMNTLHSKHFNIIYIENKDGLFLGSLCRRASILT